MEMVPTEHLANSTKAPGPETSSVALLFCGRNIHLSVCVCVCVCMENGIIPMEHRIFIIYGQHLVD